MTAPGAGYSPPKATEGACRSTVKLSQTGTFRSQPMILRAWARQMNHMIAVAPGGAGEIADRINVHYAQFRRGDIDGHGRGVVDRDPSRNLGCIDLKREGGGIAHIPDHILPGTSVTWPPGKGRSTVAMVGAEQNEV